MIGAFEQFRRKLAAIFLHESWMIGVIDQPIGNALAWTKCPPVRWLSERSSKRYLADPFAWPDRLDTVLCENYDYDAELGSIHKLGIRGDRIVSEGVEAFSLPGHLSFPFLFGHEGAVYALPESSSARELTLFRWGPEKREWSKIVSLLRDVAAADSVLFQHNGLFWVAYTDVDQSATENLNLLYAPSLTGPWQKHPLNPVVRGAEISRCGGTPFVAGGKLYRPVQDCSSCYGGAIRIMEVVACSPEVFCEREVTVILPKKGGMNPHGLHTLSAWGDRCLVDGKRMVFSPGHVLKKIRRRLAGLR